MTMIEEFSAARRAFAPIVAIRTPDPASTVKNLFTIYTDVCVVQWNIITGVVGMNEIARTYVNAMHTIEGILMDAAMVTGNPVEALRKALQHLPAKSILFFHNAHFYMEKGPGDSHKPVIQAVWNIRDPFKTNQRTVVLLSPQIEIPDELKNDVVLIDEPLPTDKELAAIVVRSISSAGGKKPSKTALDKLVDAVSGLAAFNADQVIGMSVIPKNKKIDMENVWRQKIKLVEQTRGLKVHRGGVTFSDIGGNDNIKHLLVRVAKGLRKPRLVIFLDEIEKIMQAAGTDTSGVTTDQLKVLLTVMQDYDWIGIIIYGFPGTGKSELAKAFGNEAGCPTVEADLGAMKNMWVGSSEANIRAFIKTIHAMGQDKVFFIATCNGLATLPPEFKRRFRKGIWFCDLPKQPERKVIWDIYFKKFDIAETAVKPNDEGWTGAEIRLCCENAHEFGISLKEAAKYMTITSQAMGDQVRKLREAASGTFVDAQNSGIYHYEPDKPKKDNLFKQIMMGGL